MQSKGRVLYKKLLGNRKFMSRIFYVTAALITLVGVIGCSNEGEQAQQGAQQGMPAPSVSVVTLKQEPVVHEMVLPGRVSPSRQSQVRPQVDGVITERLFEEGAHVEKGQQLYQIDEARYLAQLNSAKADLKSVQANLKTLEAKARRYDDLVAQNAVSKQEYDDVIAQKDQAQAAISVAKAAVDVAKFIWVTPKCTPQSADVLAALLLLKVPLLLRTNLSNLQPLHSLTQFSLICRSQVRQLLRFVSQ